MLEQIPGTWQLVSTSESDPLQSRREGHYPDVARTIEEELTREISRGHPLFGAECTALAYDKQTQKDYLFEVEDWTFPYAIVHLTWIREKNPEYPRVYGFHDLVECFEAINGNKWWEFWKEEKDWPRVSATDDHAASVGDL